MPITSNIDKPDTILAMEIASSAPEAAPLGKNLPVLRSPEPELRTDGLNGIHTPSIWSKYRNTDVLDTRPAPRLDWNADKNFVHRGESTTLLFSVWVSATGVIDKLEPRTRDNKPWKFDDVAQSLQATLMVPASLRGQPVASTMTVELTLDNND